MSPSPFATPDDTGPILSSDIAPSWSGFGAQEAARADFLGLTRGVNRMREYRQAESGVEDLGSQIGRLQGGEDLGDVVAHPRPPPAPLAPETVDARIKQEGLTGHLPHPSANPRVLDLQIAQAHEERDREAAIARGPEGFFPSALGLATSLGAGMLDPVGAAAFMVPVGGEAFWGARLAARTTMAGRAGVKAAQGAAQGAVGGTALVPAEWWLKTEDGQDYTFAEALNSVVMSAGMGATFHAGFGSIGDLLARRRGAPLKGSAEDIMLRGLARAQDVPGITAAEHPLPAPAETGEEVHPARRVYDDALEQLRAAGMSQETAEQNAAIVAARYDTRAGRLNDGRDAYDLYESEGLAIRRGESADLMSEYPGRAFAQGKPVEPGLFAEREAEGQTVLPGGERISDAELAQRRADQALKPKVAQKPMDVGLFGDDSKQKTLFQSEQRAPTFYSATERAIASSKQEKASPEQWLATIKNTPGVKGEELAWLGLEDWLKEQKGSVSRSAIADYVRANAIEVKETTFGQNVKTMDAIAKELGYGGWTSSLTDAQKADVNRAYDAQGARAGVRYGQYALPGGENYRELLLTLPRKEQQSGNIARYLSNFQRSVLDAIASPGDLAKAKQFNVQLRETLKGVPDEQALAEIADAKAIQDEGEAFKSSHWDEPNILSHIRFNDRTIDGKRALFIEEVQSDWHQAGKRRGFFEPASAEHLAEADKIGQREEFQRQVDEANSDRVPDAPFKTSWPELALKRMIRYAAENGYDKIAWTPGDVQAERYDLSKQIKKIELHDNTSGGVGRPRMEGPFEAGTLTAYDHEGRRVIDNRMVTARDLPDMIGKEAADKLLNVEAQEARSAGLGVRERKLEGLDLKVGGEGMKGFYDHILPAAANKLVKKFGAKVEQSSLEHQGGVGEGRYEGPEPSDAAINTMYERLHRNGPVALAQQLDDVAHAVAVVGETFQDAMSQHGSIALAEMFGGKMSSPPKTVKVHALDLTPQLRDAAIRQGFPLFQSGEGAPRGRITLGENRAVIDLFAKADRSTFMHEAGHLWLEEMIRDGSAENAPQGLKDDLSTILDWLGVAKASDIGTAHHEQWARGFEQYLAEGRAPSSRLAAAFEKFKEWLLSIYHSLASLDAPLSDGVRGVMDRMLASDAEIAEARAAPPHPAEALADLPPRAREDAMRAATADVIAGRPVRAGEMLAEAAKEDPRIAESLSPAGRFALDHPGPNWDIRFAAEQARQRPPAGIDNTHDVVSGANSSKDPAGPVYIDRHIPRFSPILKDRAGNPADLHRYLSIHERDEAERMARGQPYPAAHRGATATERAAVEADGVDWKRYTEEMDGYLSRIEHEKPVNPPPGDTHIDPQAAIGHHRSENKQPAPKGRGTMAIALPTVARTMIDDAEAYKLAAKKRREQTGGAGANKVYATTEAMDAARGVSPAEARAQHAEAGKTFDAMLAEHKIEAAEVPDEVRAVALEAMLRRGFEGDAEGALDYATAKIEREALADEHLQSILDREDLDAIAANRHVVATEEGHDLHGEIPFDTGPHPEEGGGAPADQAGEAAPARIPARQDRGRARGQADWRKFADVQHPVEDPDLASASKVAEKTKDPESLEPAKAVTAAQKAATEADKLLADILPSLSPQEREAFEKALFELEADRGAREQIVQEGAACLAAAVA